MEAHLEQHEAESISNAVAFKLCYALQSSGEFFKIPVSKLYPIAVRSDSLRVKPGIGIDQTPNDSKVQPCLKANNLMIFSQFHTYYTMRKRTL